MNCDPLRNAKKKKIIIEEEEAYEACDTHEKHKTSSSPKAQVLLVCL